MAEGADENHTNGVVDRVRPLSATAARSLTKLVENDFEMLRSEMNEYQSEQVEAKVREMRAGADPEMMERAQRQGDDIVDAFRRQRRELIDQARQRGLTVTMPDLGTRYGENAVTVKDDDLEKRVSSYRRQADREFKPLLRKSERMELEAKRRVLLASITSEAEEILKDIPSAREMFTQSQKEVTA